MSNLKIPYGIQDYKTIKEKNYLYVDKTKYIEILERSMEYTVFLRPRRFGKSLFTSMLYYYYDIKSSNVFNILFSDTYIGKNKTEEANSYYILKFDFSGIDTDGGKEKLEESFVRCVKDNINRFIAIYKLDIVMDDTINSASSYNRSFLSKFETLTNQKIYLIIDEYDHFANSILTADLGLFNHITGKNGFVRAFYEVFKSYSGTIISRMFITGVTPITLDSLASGFNNVSNRTRDELLNGMVGFTETEVINILDDLGIDKINIKTMKENYNGYLFTEEVNNKVYNSNMVLYYIRDFVEKGKPPKRLTDMNIVTDYNKITAMFDLYEDENDKKIIINDIMNNKTISINLSERFDTRLGFNKKDFISLMYYLGLLTIDGGISATLDLKTPNYVIKTVYFEYYYHYLNQELKINLDIWNIQDAVITLAKDNNMKPFIGFLETFLNAISNRDYMNFDEKYIKLLMVMYARLTDIYLAKSEYEVERKYIDVVFLPNRVTLINNYFIFEVKYIKVSEKSEKLVEIKKAEAIEQITEYGNTAEMRSIVGLHKYVLVFCGSDCEVCEEIT